jgi:hypothetical protein
MCRTSVARSIVCLLSFVLLSGCGAYTSDKSETDKSIAQLRAEIERLRAEQLAAQLRTKESLLSGQWEEISGSIHDLGWGELIFVLTIGSDHSWCWARRTTGLTSLTEAVQDSFVGKYIDQGTWRLNGDYIYVKLTQNGYHRSWATDREYYFQIHSLSDSTLRLNQFEFTKLR